MLSVHRIHTKAQSTSCSKWNSSLNQQPPTHRSAGEWEASLVLLLWIQHAQLYGQFTLGVCDDRIRPLTLQQAVGLEGEGGTSCMFSLHPRGIGLPGCP